MRVDSKFKRVIAMIAIGFALVLIQYLITGRASGVIKLPEAYYTLFGNGLAASGKRSIFAVTFLHIFSWI